MLVLVRILLLLFQITLPSLRYYHAFIVLLLAVSLLNIFQGGGVNLAFHVQVRSVADQRLRLALHVSVHSLLSLVHQTLLVKVFVFILILLLCIIVFFIILFIIIIIVLSETGDCLQFLLLFGRRGLLFDWRWLLHYLLFDFLSYLLLHRVVIALLCLLFGLSCRFLF